MKSLSAQIASSETKRQVWRIARNPKDDGETKKMNVTGFFIIDSSVIGRTCGILIK